MKNINEKKLLVLLFMIILLPACGSSDDTPPTNLAPTVSDVSITDDNGGLAVVGDSLTGNYTYNDEDGDLEGSSTFRWLRDGTAISGATVLTYTLVAADSGPSITFEVTPVAATGTATGTAVVSSGITLNNSAPTVSGVSITDDNGGTTVVGDSLTGSYTYSDVDGDAEGTSTFRWLRGGTAIPGATASTYTLVADDSGPSISFEVTPVAANGTATGTAVASSGITLTNSAPTVSGVGITDDNGGTTVVGDSLTGSYTYSDVDGDAEGTSTFRWLRGGTAIPGATALTYTLVAADSGPSISFEVTPVAANGTTTGTAVASSGITLTNSAPTVSGVGITDDNGGTTVVGDSLTGSYTYSDVDGDAEGTSTFRWLRGGTAIPGATALTYTLLADDSGQSISFEVTPVAATGTLTGTAITSSSISVNSAPTVSGVGITDDNGDPAVVGDSLTGSYTYADVDGDLEGTSTFRWLRDGTAIPGASASTYTLVAADSGPSISFEVTPVAITGTTIGTAVVSNAITVTNSAPTVSEVSIIDDNGGAALVGDSLTGSYTYADLDGDAEGTSTFRWLRSGTAIPGATTSTYTLVADDSGTSISFEVTPVASSGTITGTAVVSSGLSINNSAPTVSGVSITDDNGGSAVVGDSLTGNYTYTDADGDLEGTSIFRWLRGDTAIPGATASTYTLVADDSNQSISFEVTPVAATGTATGTAVESSSITISNSAPTVSGVSITDDNGGAVVVGDSLTGNYTYADVDGDLEGTSTFRWLRGGVPINSATASSYTLVADDSGQSITFEVTPVAATGTATGTAVVSSGITVNSAPTVSGVSITDDNGGAAVVGDSLTGNYTYADAESDLEGASTFRWLRAGTPISGATASTYTLVPDDSGQSITFEVTPVATTGTTTGTAVASSGITITNSAPTVSGVSISDTNGGSVVIGDTLTGNYTYADVDGDLEGASTFRWLRGGVAISGATASEYILTSDDSSQTITFEVTPVALTGTLTGTAVVSSGITINSAPVSISQTITINEDSPVVIQLGSDVDGDSLTYTLTVPPTNGSISSISGTTTDERVIYTPVENYNGTDTFSFTLNDGTVDSLTATVTLSINAVNDAPVANDAGLTTGTGKAAVSGTLSASDVVEGDTVTFQLLTLPTKGNVTLDNAATGAFTYTPASLGVDSFTFNVTDDAAGDPRDSNVATISITPPVTTVVPGTPVNEAAVAGDQRVSLSWDAVDYAESYNVYWSLTTGVTTADTLLVNVDKPYFYHDGVTNATPYFYIVTAVNSVGQSVVASGEMTATPLANPILGLSFTDTNLASCVTAAATGITDVNQLKILSCATSGIINLTGIEQLTSLTSLTLNGNSISDISPLANLTQLILLNLSENTISNGIYPLADMVNLETLRLATNTTITDVSPLADKSNLRSLFLGENNISSLDSLASLTGLTSLSLSTNHISDFSPLSALTSLTLLDLHTNHISDISSLSGLSALNSLYLHTNNIFDLSGLSTLTSLGRLELNNNNIFIVDALSGMSSLTTLTLQNNSVYDLAPTSGLVNLETLFLANNQVIDVSPVASMVNLNQLILQNNNIGGQGIGRVDTLVTLTTASTINLTSNLGMSCAELTTLVTVLSSVDPIVAIPGTNCATP